MAVEQRDLPAIDLDPCSRVLRVGDCPASVLRAKSFHVLEVLASAAPDPVSKIQLMEQVWPDRVVGEDSIVQCIGDIRRALGDKGQSIVQTVPGLGYRLWARFGSGAESEIARRSDAVAVLPFELAGADSDLLSFALGLGSDLVYELNRANMFRVLSPGLVDRSGRSAGEAARAFGLRGARYAMTGTVQSLGPTLRVSGFLIATETEEVVWSRRWQGERDRRLDLQERILRETVNDLANLWSGHVARINAVMTGGRQTSDLNAYDLFHRGVIAIGTFTPEGLMKGIDCLEQALAADPSYGEASAALSIAYGLLSTSVPAAEVPEVVAGRERAARAAYASRPLRGWAILSGAWIGARDRLDPAIVRERICQAVEDQPYNADLLVAAAGHAAINSDLYAEAILWVDRAFEINDSAPSWYHWPKGYAQLFAGEPREAAATLALGPQNYPELLAYRAAAESASAQVAAAARTRSVLSRVHPGFSSAAYLASEPFVSEDKRRWVARLFRSADLPA